MKNLFITRVIILCMLIACESKVFAQSAVSKVDTCLNILKGYSNYWKKDSIGENGFRELLGYKVLMNCDCNGRQWKDIVECLGAPNFTYPYKDKTEYRYRLNHFTDNIKDTGTLLLDITANKEGVIIFFAVWEVDG